MEAHDRDLEVARGVWPEGIAQDEPVDLGKRAGSSVHDSRKEEHAIDSWPFGIRAGAYEDRIRSRIDRSLDRAVIVWDQDPGRLARAWMRADAEYGEDEPSEQNMDARHGTPSRCRAGMRVRPWKARRFYHLFSTRFIVLRRHSSPVPLLDDEIGFRAGRRACQDTARTLSGP